MGVALRLQMPPLSIKSVIKYMTGYRSRVLVNGQKSDFFPIDQGVAQGALLSPTLYAIFENALQELHAGHSLEGSLARGSLH